MYRAAVHLYPPDFRREFASEMTRDFDQATREAWSGTAWPGVLVLWAHLGADFALTLVRQWLWSPWLAITLIPAAISIAGMVTVASLLAQPPPPLSVPQPDHDQIALLLLVTVVLLIVAATIILTLWFTRPLRYRTWM